jgi:DNA primase
VLNLFVQEQIDLQILTLPDELDPCDFLLARGAEPFQEQLASTIDALEHKFRVAAGGLNAASGIHDTQQAIEEVLSTLAQAPRLRTPASAAKVKEDQILNRLAQRFGVADQTLRARLAELRRNVKPRATRKPETPAPRAKLTALERTFFEMLLLAPDEAGRCCEEIVDEQLQSDAAQIIFSSCRRLWNAGVRPTFERLMLEFDDPQIKSLLVELDEVGRSMQGIDPLSSLDTLLKTFHQKRSREELKVPAAQSLGFDEQVNLYHALIERNRKQRGV